MRGAAVVTYKERKQRFFEEFQDADAIFTYLRENFSDQKRIKLKYDVEEREVFINEFMDFNKHLMIVADESYAPGSSNVIMIFGLLQKYFEIELDVVEAKGPGYYECSIRSGRRATTGRIDIRFKVNSDDVISTNFRISKHTIDMTMFTVPTSIKVILDQFESQNRQYADHFEVGLLANSQDPVIQHIRKTSQTLFVEDYNNDASFVPMTDEFVDLRQVLGHEFPRYLAKMKEKGFGSAIIVPILYLTDAEQTIPFGYINMMTKERPLTFEDVITMKEKTFKLVDRIRDANTAFIEAKQQILDISRGGARLKIDDTQLKAAMIKTRGFVFDIVFRLQAPITVYGEIKFTATDPDGSLLAGVSFTGNSSRKDEMKRFGQIMEPMELEYKKKLMMQMKGRRP
jgi:hypothetical protein